MVREPISLYLHLVGVFCRFLMPRKDASHHWCASTCPSPTQPLFTIHDKQHCGWHPRPQKIYLRPSSSWHFHLHSYDEHWAVSVTLGTEIHIWGGASSWHRTRKFFVDRECEEFIGCPPGRGIRAGISGSDRMLLGPKATEAASNKVNWGTHRLRWLLGMYFRPLIITGNHSVITSHFVSISLWDIQCSNIPLFSFLGLFSVKSE